MILEGGLLAEFRPRIQIWIRLSHFAVVLVGSNLRQSLFVYRTFVLILVRKTGRIPSETCNFAKDLQFGTMCAPEAGLVAWCDV